MLWLHALPAVFYRHILPVALCRCCDVCFNVPPPVRLRLKRMVGFCQCGAQKQRLALHNEAARKKSGRIRRRKRPEKEKLHKKSLLQLNSESHDFSKGVAQACL